MPSHSIQGKTGQFGYIVSNNLSERNTNYFPINQHQRGIYGVSTQYARKK